MFFRKKHFQLIIYKLNAIMATIQDLQASVAAQTTVIASAETLLKGLSDKLTAALANGNDPAAIQTVIDEINANTSGLSASVTTNTPSAANVPVNNATGSQVSDPVPAHDQTASTFTPVVPPISQTTQDTPIAEGGPNDPAAAHTGNSAGLSGLNPVQPGH